MRIGVVLEVVGGMSLLSWGCFYGPDWPPSVPNEDIHVATAGGSGTPDGGLPDAGDAGSFDASGAFGCDLRSVNQTCVNYVGLGPAGLLQCASGGAKIIPSCPAVGCNGCCTTMPQYTTTDGGVATYTNEACYYGVNYPSTTVQAECQSEIPPGVFTTTP